jgi:YebC/PmpR family DNA-binding regulatory protein
MSGHSKWATIKRQKGANDMRRALIFTKLASAISIAVRQGGGVTDPDGNFRLRLAIESARGANMPKENIERAIERAAGKQDSDLEEVVYEGCGPGGFSVIVEAFTDKKQRTVAEVKNAFDKNGGSMGAQGCVMYQFEKKGLIVVEKGDKSIDDVFMIAADSGADDVEEAQEEFLIYTKPEQMAAVRVVLLNSGLSIKLAEFMYKPTVLFSLSDKSSIERSLAFIEKMEDISDVQKVYVNFDIPDTI